MDQLVGRWLRAMNPLHKPRGLAEAQRAARVLSFGLGLSLLASLPVMVWMFRSDWFVTVMRAQYGQMHLSADEIAMQEALMQGMWPTMMAFGIGFSVVLYGVLAWAQWRYMTKLIPMIMLGLALYGVVANVGMRFMGLTATFDLPLWAQFATWIPFAITGVLYVASLQGAMMLERLRSQP